MLTKLLCNNSNHHLLQKSKIQKFNSFDAVYLTQLSYYRIIMEQKPEVNLRDFGTDSCVYTLNSNTVVLTVHTSNNSEKFEFQWTKIVEFVGIHPTLTGLVCGDFNATPVQKSLNSMAFYDKDIRNYRLGSL
jgi:hypothetical protein